jgi:hypothetical protein
LAWRKKLGKAATDAIKKKVQGERKMRVFQLKLISEEGDTSIETVKAATEDLGGFLISDTAKFTKWKVTCSESIADFLTTERLIHPVKHDGKGFIHSLSWSQEEDY